MTDKEDSYAVSHPVAAVLTMGVAAGFLLCGYEFVRSTSNSLFIGAYGAHRLPVVMALSPIGTLGMIYGYGWLLSRLGARRTLVVTSLLSGLGILACYGAVKTGWLAALGLLYVLREGYIVLIIEQYWSFINSTLNTEQGKKFNGPICGIASVGAIGGGLLVGQTARALGSEQLLLFAALSLLPAALFAGWAYRLGGEPAPKEARSDRGVLALDLFRKSRTLVLIALLVGVTQAVSTALDLRFHGLVEIALPEKDARTAFMGDFWAMVNTVAFACQFVVAPLMLRLIPLRGVHLAIPAVHLVACIALLIYPTLWTGAAAFLLFKTLDYSVFRAAKEILYIPLSFDARYRSKEVIDAFGYRGAKGLVSGGFALAGMVFGRLSGGVYSGVVLVMTGIWAGLGWALTGERVKATTDDRQRTTEKRVDT